MLKTKHILTFFILFASLAFISLVQAQSVSFFKQQLSGQCIQYTRNSGGTHGWATHYINTHHCPSGKLQVHEVKMSQTAYTTSEHRDDYYYSGTWEVIDRGNGLKQVFYRLDNGGTTTINLGVNAYQQLTLGMTWSHCGQAQCY